MYIYVYALICWMLSKIWLWDWFGKQTISIEKYEKLTNLGSSSFHFNFDFQNWLQMVNCQLWANTVKCLQHLTLVETILYEMLLQYSLHHGTSLPDEQMILIISKQELSSHSIAPYRVTRRDTQFHDLYWTL